MVFACIFWGSDFWSTSRHTTVLFSFLFFLFDGKKRNGMNYCGCGRSSNEGQETF